jgi:hypothetical protein
MGVGQDRPKGNGRGVKLLVATAVVATAFGASKASLPRRTATRAVAIGRAWSKRQLDRALQAPVVKSQGERWRAMHR